MYIRHNILPIFVLFGNVCAFLIIKLKIDVFMAESIYYVIKIVI